MSERNDWVLDVLVAPYGGPYGGRDAQGEFFTPETDLWLERIQRRPVVYYHGLDEREPQVIGEELGWERRADGVWFKVALDRTSGLARRVWEAARRGMARASSGAIGHLVRVAGDGRILTWPIGEISLLDAGQHAPADPYAVALVHAKALFAAAGLPGAEAFEAEAGAGRSPGDVAGDGDGSAGGSPTPFRRFAPPSPLQGGRTGWGSDALEPERAPGDDNDEGVCNVTEEQTIHKMVREEVRAAVGDAMAAAVTGPEAMFLTGRAPSVIRQGGGPTLTANGTPLVDAIKALRRGQVSVVRFQLSGKALAEGTDSAGGYLVPTEYSTELIDLLAAKTAVRAAGATVVPMASDTLDIPSQTGGATAYWVAENAQITASDQAWGQVQLSAKKLAAMTKISSELFEDSDPGVEALVRADLARALALEEDIKYLRGDGTGNTPTGLENINGVNVDDTTLGDNGGTPSFDNLADMIYALDSDDVPVEGRAWIVHPRTLNTLRQIKDSQNRYLWADPAEPGLPPTVWGYPVFTTTAIPINLTQGTSEDCSVIYLGCWPEFIIGQRKSLELRVSDEAGGAFEYDQVFVRAIMRVDCNVRHAGSFEVLMGVRA